LVVSFIGQPAASKAVASAVNASSIFGPASSCARSRSSAGAGPENRMPQPHRSHRPLLRFIGQFVCRRH
jgi:hypothetical protein